MAIDRQTLEHRGKLVEDLKQADRMQAEADAIVEPTLMSLSQKPMTEFATLGQLLFDMEELYKLRRGGIDPTQKHLQKTQQAMAAERLRRESTSVLIRTADVKLHKQVAAHNSEMASLTSQIKGRAGSRVLEARIRREQDRAERLRAGQVDDTDEGSSRQELARCNSRLKALRSQKSKQKAKAIDELNQAEQKAIDRLQAKIDAANKKMILPENMRWVSDCDQEPLSKRDGPKPAAPKPRQVSIARATAIKQQRRADERQFAELTE